MKLSDWMQKHSTTEQDQLARKCECHSNYIYEIARFGCSHKLARKIEEWTTILTPDHIVARHDLRPDIWDKDE